MFTSDDIGTWIDEADRDTARAVFAKILLQDSKPTEITDSLQVALPKGFIVLEQEMSLEALYAITEPGLEWAWDGFSLRLLDMRTLPPPKKITPEKL